MVGSQGGLAARLEARRRAVGLSQAALAGRELSASYVSLIEAGRRTPTAQVLELLAGRLGTTAAYLRDGVDERVVAERRLQLAYAEIALGQDRPADALALVAALADELEPDSGLHADVRWVRARALEQQGRSEEAVAAYEDVRAERGLEATLGLCRVSVEVGDLGRAVDLGEEALAAVLPVAASDQALAARVAAPLVSAYRLRGDLAAAERVLAVLEPPGPRPAPRADAHRAASESALAQGRLVDATDHATRAVAALAGADDDRAVALLLLARAALLAPAAAEPLVRTARDLLADAGSERDRVRCQLELARLRLAAGDVDGARELVAGEAELGPQGQLLVALCGLREDAAAGAVALVAAAESVEAVSSARVAAAAWREAGDALAAAGDGETAADAYRRALAAVGIVPATTRERVGV